MTFVSRGFDSATTKLAVVDPAPVPSTTWTSPIEISGSGSSFRIVPTACVSGTVALPTVGAVREMSTRSVSSPSRFRSPFTTTSIVFVVSPGAKVTVPLAPT